MPDQLTVDEEFLASGEKNFGIYCAICHGATGNGNGVVRQYMTLLVANLHEARFADPSSPEFRPDGELFEVISICRGQMGPYGMSIPVKERWAIVAYLRALQKAKIDSVGAEAVPNAPVPNAPAPEPAKKEANAS